MKVLHVLKTAIGASWALRQTTQLVHLGVEVHLALPDGPMVEKYQAAGVYVHILDASLNLTRPWKNIDRALKFRRLVKTVKPDIVHSHFVATTLLMRIALKGLNIPRIFHIPGPLHLEHLFYRWLDIYSATKRDFYLASCKWTETALADFGIDKHRIGLAYYGVNAEDFCAVENVQSECLRTQLGWYKDTYLIGMVAYFYAPKLILGQTRGLKGHEDLIDAIAIVRRKYPKVRCVFVGGPWNNAFEYFLNVQEYAKIKTPGLCAFLDTRQDVPQLYRQFDLAVHPSHSENLGGAVESMYASILTLTSNVGGFPDLVEDGVTGYMAKPKNPENLAEKIIEAIESTDKNRQIVKNATFRVANVMNVEENAKQVLSFYNHILDLRGKM